MTTDAEYVLERLQYGPQDAMQIISASLRDREVGLTVHSRVADLRAQGYTITCAIEGKTRKGRDRYVYRLVSEPEVLASAGPGKPRSPSQAPTVPAAEFSLERFSAAGQAQDAGFVEPPARGHAAQGAEIPAPVPDVIPGQLRLVG